MSFIKKVIRSENTLRKDITFYGQISFYTIYTIGILPGLIVLFCISAIYFQIFFSVIYSKMRINFPKYADKIETENTG